MTEAEFIDALVARINPQLDIPWVPEDIEATWIRRAVSLLSPLVTDDIRAFILDAADGLDDAELARLENILVAYLNTVIDFPVLGETTEAMILRPIVGAVLDLAKKGLSL